MRKLITFSVTCMILSILVASCGSSLSITKRHYNKGYYISSNFRKQSVSNPKEDEKLIQIAENETTYAVIDHKEKSAQVSQNNDNVPAGIITIESNDKNEFSTESTENSFVTGTSEKVKNIFAPAVNIKNAISNKKMKSTPASDGGGLSLLWIVIIVLLILWALGFISGNFGGLVHLLLVIALILLILWLLRII